MPTSGDVGTALCRRLAGWPLVDHLLRDTDFRTLFSEALGGRVDSQKQVVLFYLDQIILSFLSDRNE